MRTLIWTFRTCQGSIRLGVAAPEEQLQDLYGELKGCAVVADSMEEFISMAVLAIGRHDGMVGDVLRQPWPSMSLRTKIRNAAEISSTVEAANAILDAAVSASAEEVELLLSDSSEITQLDFIRGVASALDENSYRFIHDLAAALRVEPERLNVAFRDLGN